MFKNSDMNRADWSLLQNGPITLFRKREYFVDAINALSELKYHIIQVRYSDRDSFYRDMSAALKWEQQFGYQWQGNLDAFDDGLIDEPFSTSSDSAICVENFDRLVADDREWSWNFLDIIADNSRSYLLSGKRLICLIQTNDSDFDPGRLGGLEPQWNSREWLTTNRR